MLDAPTFPFQNKDVRSDGSYIWPANSTSGHIPSVNDYSMRGKVRAGRSTSPKVPSNGVLGDISTEGKAAGLRDNKEQRILASSDGATETSLEHLSLRADTTDSMHESDLSNEFITKACAMHAASVRVLRDHVYSLLLPSTSGAYRLHQGGDGVSTAHATRSSPAHDEAATEREAVINDEQAKSQDTKKGTSNKTKAKRRRRPKKSKRLACPYHKHLPKVYCAKRNYGSCQGPGFLRLDLLR